MFSIFHGLFTIFAYGFDNFNKKLQDDENKERAKKSGAKTFYGSRGNEYLVENNKWVSTKLNAQGETVISDMRTSQVYYNLTQDKKKEKERECLNEGKTVRLKMFNERNSNYYGKWKQSYGYVDITTGCPVKEIRINNISFYINLDNALILRPIDGEDLSHLLGAWSIEEIIDIINKRQKRISKEISPDEYNKINKELFYNNYDIYIAKDKTIKIFWKGKPSTLIELLKKDGFKFNKEKKKWM